ncbi:hypothetical protein CPB84DRAFT_1787009, partial [Gymnopilus junonius]
TRRVESGGRPDALGACNAWWPAFQAAHLHRIPFATTEYAEQSAEHQREMIISFILQGMRITEAMQREK